MNIAVTPVAQSPLKRYLRFLDISDADAPHARALWRILEPHIAEIVERFYARIRQTEVGFHVSTEMVERLQVRQKEHWAKLFASEFDESYAASVQRVGIRHRDIKLSAAWYVAGYMSLKMEIVQLVLRAEIGMAEKGRVLRVAEKYVALDMSIALSAYEDQTVLLD